MSADGSAPDPTAAGPPGPDLAARVAQLIYALRNCGITADTRQAIAVERLLMSLQPRWAEPDFDLAAHLGPIFCRSMEEQRRFREVVAGLELLQGHVPSQTGGDPAPPIVPHKSPKKSNWRLSWRAGFVTFILLLLGTIAVFQFWPKPPIVGETGETPKPPSENSGEVVPPIKPPPPTTNTAPAKLLSYHRIMLRKPLARPSLWSWAWAAVPLVCFAGWYLNHREKRPRLRRESTDLPQVFQEVRLPGGPREPLSRMRVRELSRSLRIRQRVAGRELHIDSTITRTIENGGLPTPVFESLIEPRYLVLIDRTGIGDHFSELSNQLLGTLQSSNVDCEAFEFDGNPTYCNIPRWELLDATQRRSAPRRSKRRDSERFRFKLTEILDRLPDRPLLILSDGARFLNPFTDAPPEWFTWVNDRPRILITPASDEGDWTSREQKLRRHGFQVIPMTPTGIPEVASVLSGIESPRRDPQRHSLSFEDEPDRCLSIFQPPADFIQRLCRELRGHLGSDGFLWLASLGAYPELHWGLTLRFGASLITNPDGTTNDERWEQLLPRMTRLIWLRQGFMPDWLRDALKEKLSPQDQNRIHQLLVEILSICDSEAAKSESQADAAKEVPLRIVIEKPVGLWNRLQSWGKRRQIARKEAFETRSLKQRLVDSWHRWTAWWTKSKDAQKPAKQFDAVFLRYLAPQVPEWLAPIVPERLLRLLSQREGWLRGPSLWFSVGACAVLMIGVYSGAERVRARRFQVQSLEVSHGGESVVTRHRDAGTRGWRACPVTTLEFKGHRYWVYSVAFSPDGQRIVTGSDDKTARVWNARTGQLLVELQDHTSSVNSVAYSPDGQRIVTGSFDNTARVWDARTGQSLVELQGHTRSVNSVAYSPDGQWIVTGSGDKTARVWDARTGQSLVEMQGRTSVVSSVAFSPDGQRIVTGFGDTARVWDARTGQSLVELQGHTNAVTSVAFSPDGQRIVSGSWDGTARVWDARSGQSMIELTGHTNVVESVAFSPDGERIVSGSRDYTARIWDLQTEKYDLALPSGIQWIGMSTNSHRWATREPSGAVAVHQVARPELVLQLEVAQGGPVVLLSSDGTQLAVGRENEVVFHSLDLPNASPTVIETSLAAPVSGTWGGMSRLVVWDRQGGGRVVSRLLGEVPLKLPSEIVGHSLSPDQRTMAIWNQTGQVSVVDLERMVLLRELTLDGMGLPQVTFGPRSDIGIAWNDSGQGVIFWPRGFQGNSDFASSAFNVGHHSSDYIDLTKSPGPPSRAEPDRAILFAGFSESGKSLYLHSPDHKLMFERVFDPDDREGLSTRVLTTGLQSVHTTVEDVKQVVQGDDNTLAVVFTDGSVRLYDAQYGVPLSDPLPTSGKVTLAAFGRPAPASLEPSQPPMTTAALFQVPVSPSKGDLSKQPKVSPKQDAAPEYEEKGKAADPKRPVVAPETPLEKGADPKQEEPAAAPIPPTPEVPEPDTRQALSLVTEEGNIEVWELNNSGRAVALLISGVASTGASQPTQDLANLLESRFGFEVQVLTRPTKQQVDEAWNRLRSTLSPSDRFVMVLEGSSDTTNGKYVFSLDGSSDQRLVIDDIRAFMDNTRAGQSLLIAAASPSGLLIGKPAAQASTDASPRSILVFTASGQSLFKGPVDTKGLLSEVQASAELDDGKIPPEGSKEASAIFQFGPLTGSQHSTGAKFYFPAARQVDTVLAPVEGKTDATKDDPAPPVDAKAEEEPPPEQPKS